MFSTDSRCSAAHAPLGLSRSPPSPPSSPALRLGTSPPRRIRYLWPAQTESTPRGGTRKPSAPWRSPHGARASSSPRLPPAPSRLPHALPRTWPAPPPFPSPTAAASTSRARARRGPTSPRRRRAPRPPMRRPPSTPPRRRPTSPPPSRPPRPSPGRASGRSSRATGPASRSASPRSSRAPPAPSPCRSSQVRSANDVSWTFGILNF